MAVIFVHTFNDTVANDGFVSLREAIQAANTDTSVDFSERGDGADTIVFQVTAGTPAQTLTLTQGELIISSDVTIIGNFSSGGADLTISGNNASRVFSVSDGAATTISATLVGLVIQDGSVTGPGSRGGGIYVGEADGLRLINSTVSDNSASSGGGIYGDAGAAITLTNATVSGNSANSGGGIYGDTGAAITLTNSTVSGNSAVDNGAGINGVGGNQITLINSTVTGNSAGGMGGGVSNVGTSGVTTLVNSIVAGNDAGTQGDDLFGGTTPSDLVFSGGNIVGSAPESFDQVIGTPTLIDGSDQTDLETVFGDVAPDPNTGVLAGVLAANSGPVKTVAIRSGGIAHNAGDNGGLPADTQDFDGDGNVAEPLPIDARGLSRVVGASVDIGAFEFQAVPQALVVTTLADEDYGGGDFAAETADGFLSLREAVGLANADGNANAISFAASLAGGTLFLSHGQLTIAGTVTIDGDIDHDGTPDITIDADPTGPGIATSRVFSISDDSATTIAAALSGLVIRNGTAATGGGILVGQADELMLTNSTVSDNSAGRGGGIFGDAGAAITLSNVTVSGNSANYGGGISGDAGAAITLTNATVSGNSAVVNAGGIEGFNGNSITLINSTVTGNSVGGSGGGISNFGAGGVTTLVNSIVAGNAATTGAGDDLFGGTTSDLVFTGGNIVGSAPENFDTVTGTPTAQIDGSNQAALETVFGAVAANPDTGVLSGVLAANSGPLETVAIRAGGIAHNAGGNGELPADAQDLDHDGNVAEQLPIDARGLSRVVGASVDIGAFEFQATAAALVVTTLDDESYGGGDFAAETADGHLSLREALGLANGGPDANTITFDSSLAGGTIVLTHGQLEITTDGVSVDGDIDGDGTADITLSGNSASRVFSISNGAATTISAALNGFVIQDGSVTGPGSRGGGIYVGEADGLTLTNSTVSGNSTGGLGGGFYVATDAALAVINSTVSGNSADSGGGIHVGVGAAVTLVNATISGNDSANDGGGINGFNGNPITLINSTVTGNSAGGVGGGVSNFGASGVTTLVNSIVAGNAATGAGDDLFGGTTPSDLVFSGGNIVGSAPASFDTVTGPFTQIDGTSQAELETVFADVANNPDTGVLSGVLADNGGSVETVAIRSDGIARDAGDNGELPADAQDLDHDGNVAEPLPVDARGLPRVVGASVDLGAFETGQLLVTTLDDENYGGGSLADELADGAGLSLREALGLANTNGGADAIAFAAALAGGTILLTHGQLEITTDDVSVDGDIDGDDTADITISGNSANRVFFVSDGAAGTISAALNGLVIQDGRAVGVGVAGNGGGIHVGETDGLTLTNSTVTGNTAAARGGGIYGDGDVTLLNTTVSNNSAYSGGGLFVVDHAATLVNSTFSGNSADLGGGIYGFSELAQPVLTLTNVTVSGNAASAGGGGIYNFNGALTIANSIVAGNAAPLFDPNILTDLAPTFVGGNIVGDTFTVDGGSPQGGIALADIFASVVSVNPGGFGPFDAGELADNGGRVQTIALNPDAANPAIDTGTGTLPADTHDLDHDGNVAELLPVDARGFARDIDFDGTPPTPDLGAFEQHNAVEFLVTTLADGGDDDYGGSGLAAEQLDGGGLSLREALALANVDPRTADAIRFDDPLAGGTVALASGALVVSGDVTIDGDIDGDGDLDITVSAANASAVFRFETGTSTLNGVAVTGGNAPTGAGVTVGAHASNDDADVTISNADIFGNVAHRGGGIAVDTGSSLRLVSSTMRENTGFDGGAIAVARGGEATVIDSSLAGNRNFPYPGTVVAGIGNGAGIHNHGFLTVINSTISGGYGDSGAGIYNINYSVSDGGLTLINTTIANNHARYFAGGLYSNGYTTVINSTVTGNYGRDTGGLSGATPHTTDTLVLVNSIVAGNRASVGRPTDVDGSMTMDGVNVFSQAGVGRPGIDITESNLANIFAAIDPNTGGGLLADNGGPVQTVAIRPDGVARDAGHNGELPDDTQDLDHDGITDETLPVDARGAAREVGTVDIGAVEWQVTPADLVVTTVADEGFDGGDVFAEQNDGAGLSLREALVLANADPDDNTITFAPSLAGTVELDNALGQLTISSDVTIVGDTNGDDTADITVDGDDLSRVFNVTAGTSTLEALVITGGEAGTGFGGGVNILASAELTIVNTTVADNDADRGGGIHNAGTLTLVNATLSGNSSIPGNGGGLYNAGTAVLTNVTLAGNSAELGGGMFNASAGIATLTNTTVSGNTASDGAGIRNAAGGQFTLANSIVLGHVVPGNFPEIYGTVTYAGINIVGLGGDFDPGGGVMNAPSFDAVFAQVGLNGGGVLADNGGPVQTIALNTDPANLAINAGVATRLDETAVGIDLNGDGDELDTIATDARGFARVVNGGVDLGAFEIENTPPTQGANNGLTLDEGDSATLVTGQLDFNDAEQGDADIAYAITTATVNGTLLLNGNPLGVGDTFTQDDINNNRVTYTHDGSETLTDSFAFDVSDGVGGTAAGTFAFTINPVNDQAGGAAGGSILYVEDQAPTALDPSLTVTDPDSLNLVSAQVAITGNFAAGQDVLGFTPQSGITGSYNAITGVLTLTGVATLAQYQDTLRSVTYANSSQNPSDAARTVAFQVDDGGGLASLGNVSVNVLPVLDTPNDINGDHTSDIVWRSDDGTVAVWEMNGVDVLANNGIATLPNYWHIVDANGDFDGDGRSDILWRDDAGTVVLWNMDGPDILSNTVVAGPIADYWHIEDTGDFTADGRGDILWRDTAGRVVLWEMDGATIVSNTLVADVATTSQIQDTADVTGDGMNDILWRDDDGTIRIWEMNGATIVSDTTIATLPDYWQFADTGDFNGDTRLDILWRDTAGTVVMWEMDGATIIGNTMLGTLPDYWFIADTGDYTGDLNHDILWRDTAGTIALWEMNGPVIVDNSAVNTIPTHWHIVG